MKGTLLYILAGVEGFENVLERKGIKTGKYDMMVVKRNTRVGKYLNKEIKEHKKKIEKAELKKRIEEKKKELKELEKELLK